MKATYSIYYCIDGMFRVEQTLGYPIQIERKQYLSYDKAYTQACYMNKLKENK